MACATSSSVFLLPPQLLRRRQSTSLPCTKTTSFPPLPLPPLTIGRRRRFTPSPISSSLKEKIGGIRKTWSDLSSLNYWVVKDYYRLVSSVNSLEPHIQKLSDEQLSAKTGEFRQRLIQGATLADIQAEAFAVVREAAKRKLGMRHFDVQIIGGAALHDGSIAEMKTGEGKTLVSTLAAYLNALSGRVFMRFSFLLRVLVSNNIETNMKEERMTPEERRLNYQCDITYTNNSELGFDYLRDNLSTSSEQLVMRWPKPFHFAIVDEVDSVLIDEGRNPLLISGEASKDAARYPVAARVAELLIRGLHYNVELKDNSVELTEEGIVLAEMALETNDLWDENDPWARFVLNALKAKEFYRRDVQYIVRNGKALIINELTGRVVEKRRWSEGIHQAVEAKEGLKIQADSVVVAQITYQSLFKLYPKLSGMTGTAKTEEKEFLKMFQMPVIEVPTNMPNIRKDLPIQAFATARGKWEYVRAEIEYMFRLGRPVLVGTTSVENSEHLSALLRDRKIPHNVLNARPKYAAREAEIVAQAGRKYAITLSTNMAGRGTDIILGGNPKMLAKEILEDTLLSSLTQNVPDVEIDSATSSEKVLSKVKLGPASLGLLAKTAVMSKYVCKSEGKRWTYDEARNMISESIELSQSMESTELQKLVNEQTEMYPLGPSIALAYLSVLKECESHCYNEAPRQSRKARRSWINTVYESCLHMTWKEIGDHLRYNLLDQLPSIITKADCLQDEMFQKFNFDTEWAVKLISRITNDEDIPIEGHSIVKQVHASMADEIIFKNVDPTKHPSSWSLGKLLKEFNVISGKLLNGVTEEHLLQSLTQVHGLSSIDIDEFHLPSLPKPPSAFRGIRMKSSSLKRWLTICSDDSMKNGKFRPTVNLLCKHFGDFLIASYLDVIQESGYDSAYVKEIEVNVRSFGHRNPLEEYKIDGCRFFISMLSATRRVTVESLLRDEISLTIRSENLLAELNIPGNKDLRCNLLNVGVISWEVIADPAMEAKEFSSICRKQLTTNNLKMLATLSVNNLLQLWKKLFTKPLTLSQLMCLGWILDQISRWRTGRLD
ncbi:UNVERIFIED_CONTAM: protein translocase subunit SECA2, chloroplastic [Sesamum latifolium]|uniref:chloroplast protein-transporting ATPase n=1 Tax=Sesamum latifolium TaxID=2727402 RepID=A0AAW2VT40_9LAMI